MNTCILYPFNPAVGASGRKQDAADSFEVLHGFAGIKCSRIYLDEVVSDVLSGKADIPTRMLLRVLSAIPSRLGYIAATALAGRHLIKKNQPDVIVVYALTSFPVICALAISFLTGLPYWIYDHRSYYASLKAAGRRPSLVQALAIRRARVVVALTTGHKNDLQAVFPEVQSDVLPVTPVNRRRKSDHKVRVLGERDSFKIAALTSWREIKRLDVLVGGFCRFASQKPNCKLVVAGPLLNCEANEAAKRILERYNLSNQIDFCGQVDRYSANKIIATAHCVAISSDYESMGLPAVEALFHGTPVVTTNCGGPPEFLSHSSDGFVVPVDDPQALAVAFESIYANLHLYDHQSIAARAEKRFSLRAQAIILKAIYERAIPS